MKNVKTIGLMVLFIAITTASIHAQDSTSVAPGPVKKEKKFKISDYLSVGGWIDAMYFYENQTDNNGETSHVNTFQIRRARLDLKAEITQKISFRLQADFAGTPKLVDAFIKVKFNKYINLQVGQFKTPLSVEKPYPTLDLETMDYAQVISKLTGYKDVSGVSSYANGRDIGLMFYGSLAEFKREDKAYPLISYSLGVFNGNGINLKDNNVKKDYAGKLEIRPFLKNLVLSGSAYLGNYGISDTVDGDRIRYAGGAEYKDKHLTVRSEYIYGQTGFFNTIDNRLENQKSQGFYVFVGYWFFFNVKDKWAQKIRPVFRYDYYKEDLSDKQTASTYYTIGADWWLEKHLRLQVNYSLQDKEKYNQLGHYLGAMLSVKF